VAKTSDGHTRHLLHVKYAVAALEECRASLDQTVASARSAGVSWTEIADAMGISPRAALDRFGTRDPAEAP
jgi:hypothetical protein